MGEDYAVSIGADEAGARIGAHIAEAEERVQEAARLARQLSSLRRTSHSRDGAVSVTVDVAGRVTALRIQAFAMLGSPDALASSILSCIAEAQVQAGRGFVEAAAAVWGPESELTGRVRQAVGGDRPPRPG
ncbi:YbaB/EbfC family nucleoid-associated protein [Actinomyces bowdenii]|uniref:YbaB/EbfC family nucleoid-associated protein n=1 Tax=Actinomyces bowdenii TaxID=131109 RepID=UPI003C7B8510